jgi:hypothetical protein
LDATTIGNWGQPKFSNGSRIIRRNEVKKQTIKNGSKF